MTALRLRLRIAASALALLALAAPRLHAQQPVPADTTRARLDTTTLRGRMTPLDLSARPPLSPRRAFLYSLLVPGLGQAKLNRPNAGTIFAGVEMGAALMARKAARDLRVAERYGRDSVVATYRDSSGIAVPATYETSRYAPRLKSRRTQYEDWIAVILFNHLFAGADAFVAAQLWDMPTRVSASPTRDGVAVAASVAFGRARRK